MDLKLVNQLSSEKLDLVYCPVLQNSEQIKKILSGLKISDQKIFNRLDKENFQGKKGQLFIIHQEITIALFGTGQEQKLSPEDWREAAGSLVRFLEDYQANIVGLLSLDWLKGSQDIERWAESLSSGIQLALYKFSKYKKIDDKQPVNIKELVIELKANKRNKFKKGWQSGELLAQGTNLARDLVNEPAQVMNPEYLAITAKNLSGKGVSVKVLEKEDCQKLGMNAFLGVAQGSPVPPKFIHLTYRPKARTKNKVAVVGKGITFDSGGLNIKPGDSMIDMKIDMGGAATVLGLFSILAELKPRVEVHGIIAACENMPSGSAFKPGDVVSNLQGKTIEIGNTDAEGRVTLADSLAYAQKKGIKTIVDLATLTGAVLVALGNRYAGLFTNNQLLGKSLVTPTMHTGEKIWLLPMPEEYKELNKSMIADIRNIPSTRYGGAITAAMFLQEFIDHDVAWAHLDIAGPVYAEKSWNSYTPVGGVGFGVRTLAEWLRNY